MDTGTRVVGACPGCEWLGEEGWSIEEKEDIFKTLDNKKIPWFPP